MIIVFNQVPVVSLECGNCNRSLRVESVDPRRLGFRSSGIESRVRAALQEAGAELPALTSGRI